VKKELIELDVEESDHSVLDELGDDYYVESEPFDYELAEKFHKKLEALRRMKEQNK